MRLVALGLTLIGLLATPMLAAAADDDSAVTREQVEQKKREVREMERELREQERERERQREAARQDRDDDVYDDDRTERRRARRAAMRMWVGVGAGVGYGAVDVTCTPGSFGDDCREEGILNTYTGNVTLAGPAGALRLRGIRQADKGDDARTPYETAALIGTRFGRSDWYGLAGYGRVRHPDDEFPEDRAAGFAWEILFAPSSSSLTGLELSFQGNSGEDVDWVGFSIGLRLGALR